MLHFNFYILTLSTNRFSYIFWLRCHSSIRLFLVLFCPEEKRLLCGLNLSCLNRRANNSGKHFYLYVWKTFFFAWSFVSVMLLYNQPHLLKTMFFFALILKPSQFHKYFGFYIMQFGFDSWFFFQRALNFWREITNRTILHFCENLNYINSL